MHGQIQQHAGSAQHQHERAMYAGLQAEWQSS